MLLPSSELGTDSVGESNVNRPLFSLRYNVSGDDDAAALVVVVTVLSSYMSQLGRCAEKLPLFSLLSLVAITAPFSFLSPFLFSCFSQGGNVASQPACARGSLVRRPIRCRLQRMLQRYPTCVMQQRYRFSCVGLLLRGGGGGVSSCSPFGQDS